MENINNKDFGLVYIMYNQELNIIKIGKTRDIQQRIFTLSCASGCELTVVYTTKPVNDYSRIEKEAHIKFNEYRRSYGEWFNIESHKVIMFIGKLIDDKKEHPISKMYREGIGISDLSIKYNVSRAYITKLLKCWGVYKANKSICLLKKPRKEKKPCKNTDVENDFVPSKYRRNVAFIRIGTNLYKHKQDDVYKTRVFINGIIKERFFIEKEQAINSLSQNI